MSDDLVPKSWFETWRIPRDFFCKTNECMGQFEADEILGMTGVQHLFDAYVAGLFSRIWNDHRACEVRLCSDDFPDAQVRDIDSTFDLEITMADEKDRRMAAEYRHLREMSDHCQKKYALEAIPRVCRQKVKKYLGAETSDGQISTHLLIYVNFSTLDAPIVSDQEMMQLTKPWKHNFLSIWLLCGARIFRAWPTPKTLAASNDPIG